MPGWKLTAKQRAEIVAIAALQRGIYSAYPLKYIAALYGVGESNVGALAAKARRKAGAADWRRRPRSSRDINHMGVRQTG